MTEISRLAVPIGLLLFAAQPGPSRENVEAARPVVLGLDHVIVAVRDLDGAAETYRRLGFALKPGRLHANSILNQHVKFEDGSEIELLTASQPRDDLARGYVQHIAAGDGPAYVAFYAPDLDRLERTLRAADLPYKRTGGLLSPKSPGTGHIFFGQRNRVPSDRPEHFAHANGAETLLGVWIAGDDIAAETSLLEALGARASKQPSRRLGAEARVWSFPQAEVAFVPKSHQIVPGRRVVGARVRARDLKRVTDQLSKAGLAVPPVTETAAGRSVLLPPSLTHGLWLEFFEPRDGQPPSKW